MFKILLKKQMAEIFRSYFYDAKKNKKRSLASTIGFFVAYILIMVGVLGGMFTYLSVSLCGGFSVLGLSWMYFLIMGLVASALGILGSVFNTFSGLYMAKDNDLLLSMPVPVRSILMSRMATVYLMGLMYSAVVIIPAEIVYFVKVRITPLTVLGGLVLILIISFVVLVLSCILGWCVAKISLKLKNKSIVTVLLSLAFFALYYFVYFKAQSIINDLLLNAVTYGGKVKKSAYPFYLFGRIGEGDIVAMLVFAAVTALLTFAAFYILSRSFINIVTSSGNTSRVAYKEKRAKQRSEFGALLSKELSRFTSSPNYMLNCGLGSVFLPVAGIVFLIKGSMFTDIVKEIFEAGEADGMLAVIVVAAVCMIVSMNDIVVPSVSLEGKNLWIVQSLPINKWNILKAKLWLQLLVTGVPLVLCDICLLAVLRLDVVMTLLVLLIPILFLLLMTFGGLFLGLLRPNLEWTNELAPIKQSLIVMIALFGGWALVIAMMLPYIFAAYKLGAVIYLLIVGAVILALDVVLYMWLKNKGTVLFEQLAA